MDYHTEMTNSTIVSPFKMTYGWNFTISGSGLKMMVESALEKYIWNSSMRSPCHFYYWICTFEVISFNRKWLAHGGISKICFRPLFTTIFRQDMLKFHPYSIFTRDTTIRVVILCVKQSQFKTRVSIALKLLLLDSIGMSFYDR